MVAPWWGHHGWIGLLLFSLSLVLGFACFLAGLIVGLRKRKAEEGHAPRFLGVSLAIVGGDSLASLSVVG